MKKIIKFNSLVLAVAVFVASCNLTGNKKKVADSLKMDSLKKDSVRKKDSLLKVGADTTKADTSVPIGSGPTHPGGGG